MEVSERLRDLIDTHDRIVFFGGAGVSTESGIPDYRSRDGIYNRGYKLPAETLLSDTYFYTHTKEFYDFYRDVMVHPQAKPNAAHITLAKLEERGKLRSVITQNIDGLHQKAGQRTVRELHGSVYRNTCLDCGKKFGVEAILDSDGIPKCSCGGTIKPDVVLYGEGLDPETVNDAVNDISHADLLIIGGTSLNVYPAAGLIDYFRGDKLVVINLQPTGRDAYADLVVAKPIGEVLGGLRI